MKKKRVWSYNSLPTKLPFDWTLLCVLFQRVYAMPGWSVGVMWTVMFVVWFGSLYYVLRVEENIDIPDVER